MSDRVPPSRDAIVGALEALFESDERWQPRLSPDVTIVARVWPDDTTDTLVLLSPDTAYAFREDAEGRRPWSMRGSLEQIVHHARTLLPPDDPNAPKAISSDLPRAEWR